MTNYARSFLGMMSELTQRSQSPPRSMSMDVDEQMTEGYDENFDPPVSSIMECPICLLVLRNPMQTRCGHRFCKYCIEKVLREGRKACPVDNEPLDENEVFADNYAKREILNYPVRCKNFRERGCEWHGPLKELPTHKGNCLYEYVGCTNGCGVEVLRADLEKHLKDECVKRIESCNYCKIKVVFKDLEEHHSTCENFPVFCPNMCSRDPIVRKQLERHLMQECVKAVVACPCKDIGCTFEGFREEVNQHFQQEFMSHIGDVVKRLCELKTTIEKDVAPVKNIQHASLPQLAQKVAEIENQVKEVGDKGEQGIQLAELYYSTQNNSISKLDNSIKDLTARFDTRDIAITELQAKVWNGNFVWKIVNFDKLFKQASSGEVPAIHSAPFYSGIPGYKMCLRVNLNGVDSGASTHISMFVHLMQGDFDAFLQWPFPGKITLVAIDQSDTDPVHVTETLIARPGLQAFMRPRTARNHKGYGYVEMIAHTVLKTREYLKNNSLIVHVAVSTTD